MRRIRAIAIGVGKVVSGIHKIMVGKAVEIVGAIDVDPSKAGKDLGEATDLGYPLNVEINDDADKVLSEYEAYIAVISAAHLEIMYQLYAKCIENGLNVITTDNQSTYPWTLYPELTSKLDKLPKTFNVTVTASGNQDIFGITKKCKNL